MSNFTMTLTTKAGTLLLEEDEGKRALIHLERVYGKSRTNWTSFCVGFGVGICFMVVMHIIINS